MKKNVKNMIYMVQTNIDDMDPQVYGVLMDRLFDINVLDVYWTPIYGKKSRPATLVTVLCEKNVLKKAIDIILEETTTFGVRYWPVERTVLKRTIKEIKTPLGKIKVKVGRRGNKVYNISPEYEDCKKIAIKKGVPVKRVLQEVKVSLFGKI